MFKVKYLPITNYLGEQCVDLYGINYQGSPVYEITTKRKQARTHISLKSGLVLFKFSEILQAHPRNNRSRVSGLTIISIPVEAILVVLLLAS